MADPPAQRGPPRHLDATGDREVVYCHQCEHEWYRDEHGLICPNCQGEATEIISPENDPRDMDDTAGPSDELQALQQHNPWLDNDVADPEEGDVEEYVTHGPNHTMFFSSRTIRPDELRSNMERNSPNENDPNHVIRDFQNMIGNFMGPGLRQGQAGRSGPDALYPSGGNAGFGFPPLGSGRPGPHVTGGRFVFTATTRPRNTDGPPPRGPPVEDLATYASPPAARSPSGPHVLFISIRARPDQLVRLLGGLFGAMGQLDEARNAGGHQHSQQNDLPPGLQGLFASIFNPAGAVAGDAVYSQEALDRIVSTLMEQHPTSNAPGPASPSAIAALPKKKLDEKMLGPELKADCSVCMDDVFLGDEVVVLPCTHWFHEACASAWLSEHNTCPICRTSITDGSSSSNPTPANPASRSDPGSSPNPWLSSPSPEMSAHRQNTQRANERNEARLQAIRASSGRLDATPEEGLQRYHIIGDPARSAPPSPPQMPGAYESSRGLFSRRASSTSDPQHDSRGGLSRSVSSRGSMASNHGSNTSNGPMSWLRRFSGGSGRRQE
ncbi:MAG: hypothetical protein M1818_000900 [Claussenomyces sp. TS43310]|nr:MAG: hypothetical protein M1818_000900 [Claussenomyces sp. TS43310]